MRSALPIMLVIVWTLVVGNGCKREAPLPLEVEYAGCAKVLVGPVCGLGEKRELRFWLRVLPSAKIRASADGEMLAVTPEEIADGVGFGVRVPEGAKELALEVTTEAGKGTWRLAVTTTPKPAAILAAESLWNRGKSAQAEVGLFSAMPNMRVEDRPSAVSLLGRIALAAGRSDDAIVRLGEAMDLHERFGCVSCRTMDGVALSYALVHNGRLFERARAILDGLTSSIYLNAEMRVHINYHQGLLAYESGDLRSALRVFMESQEGASRLGMEFERRAAAQMLGMTWQALGDNNVATNIFASLRGSIDPQGDMCELASLRNNSGWLRLLRNESILSSDTIIDVEAVRELEEALKLYEKDCPQPVDAANTLVNLSLAMLHAGDLCRARQYLVEADARLPQPEPRLRLWKLDIAGRIALASGRAQEAAALFKELERLGEEVEAVDARWRAAQGQAHALTQLRRYEEALAAHERAEMLLDEAARRVALGDGRDAFLSLHARGTAAYIELLVARGDVVRAAVIARRSRNRVIGSIARIDRLATLEPSLRARWDDAVARYLRERSELESQATSDWKLSGEVLHLARERRRMRQAALRQALDDALATLDHRSSSISDIQLPPEGELILLLHPLRNAWIVFAITKNGTTATTIRTTNIATNSSYWLAEFDRQISDAKRIRIIAAGKADFIDFHALSWRGAPLLAHAPIAYGLDAGESPETVLPQGPAHATVLADTGGNLPAARREAEDVATLLTGKRWQVDRLLGDEAQLQAVRQVMETSQLLHFGGHGQSARRGLSAALELAQGELSAGDILALPRVPPVVVLAACDSARASGDGPVVGIGLAHAFIAAGSSAAVAARRRVDDHLTRALMRAFYRRLDTLDGWSVAEALRAAQLERYRADPTSDWAAFRVLLP